MIFKQTHLRDLRQEAVALGSLCKCLSEPRALGAVCSAAAIRWPGSKLTATEFIRRPHLGWWDYTWTQLSERQEPLLVKALTAQTL